MSTGLLCEMGIFKALEQANDAVTSRISGKCDVLFVAFQGRQLMQLSVFDLGVRSGSLGFAVHY